MASSSLKAMRVLTCMTGTLSGREGPARQLVGGAPENLNRVGVRDQAQDGLDVGRRLLVGA
jgi:hypothetical protein